MDVPLLILLGASGGALRGLVDVYNRILEWQADRRAFRQFPSDRDSGEPPRLTQYFDPVADSVATGLHTALGAGVAVLFGTTGQISGAYAAFAVGVSAPALLIQLGRIPVVGNAVTQAPQPVAPATGAAEAVSEAGAQAAPAPPVGLPPGSSEQAEPSQQPAAFRPPHHRGRRPAPANPMEESLRPPHRPVTGEEGTA